MNWRDTVSPFLQVLYGSTVRPYSTYDFGRAQDASSISVIAAQDARKKLPVLRERIPSGLAAFIGTSHWLGDEKHEGVEIVVAPCETQFDILQIARTADVNGDQMTDDLIAHLKTYDDKYGIDIFEATTDTLSFMLITHPADMEAFAEELYALCPDAVDQGSGSVEQFREDIRRTSEVHLWWD